MADNEKLVITVTHGPDEVELATIPFVMAGAAGLRRRCRDGFQGEGCLLMKQGVAEAIEVPSFIPVRELLKTIREFGGEPRACVPGPRT